MHELSIALSIIDQIEDEMESRCLHDVEAIHLKLGVFSGVDSNALLFAWELACEGTSLEGSRLEIETVPLLVYCAFCCRKVAPPSCYQICCPDCGTPALQIVQGRELEVVSLEVAA